MKKFIIDIIVNINTIELPKPLEIIRLELITTSHDLAKKYGETVAKLMDIKNYTIQITLGK